jgi:phospholipid/cholesterol/gamma-HCH transport system substrate-binding protein
MGKETYALYTGLFVLILGTALIGISVWLGHYGEERDIYIVSTQGAVSGLNAESTVLYRGVLAGKVASINFDPQDSRNILVKIEVKHGLPITHGTFARLRIQGLTGLAQVELNDGGKDQRPLATDKTHPATIPLQPSLVDKLSESGDKILERTEQLLGRLSDLLNEENRGHAKAILANIDTVTGKLPELEQRLGQTLGQAHDAAAAIEDAATQFKEVGAKGKETLARFDSLPAELQKLSIKMQTLADNASALAQSGKTTADTTAKTTLPQLNGVMDELRATSAQIRKLSGLLEKDPQALLYGRNPSEPGPGEPGYQEPR